MPKTLDISSPKRPTTSSLKPMPKHHRQPVSWLGKWSTVAVLSLALAIIVIDTTLVNVSLGTIIRELHTNVQSLQWVITAYALTLAALTITGGRLGDLFGRKRMFVGGAIIFAIGSLVASLAPNVGILLLGESIIEGVGAALMMPATASLLVSNYAGRDRAIAFGVWGGVAAAGSAIGPVLGGYLTSHYSWRWGFRINVFVAAVLVLGSGIIREAKDNEEVPSLDFVGVLLSASGLLAGVYAIIEAASYGWWRATQNFAIFGHSAMPYNLSIVPIALVASVGLLTGFVLWEQAMTSRGKTPLVSMELFSNKQFSSGAVTTMILSLGQVGLIFALPVFLQAVRGLDALHTGYALLPLSAALLVAAPVSGFMSAKVNPKRIVQTGLVIDILALFTLRQSLSVTTTAWGLAPGLVLYGIGMGMCMSQLSNLTLSAVSVDEAGEASGVNNTMRQIGSSLGSAIIGAVLLSTLSAKLHTGILASSQINDAQKAPLAMAVTRQASAVEFGSPNSATAALEPATREEIKRISDQSTTTANKASLLYTMGFVLLAVAASTQLPNRRNVEQHTSIAASSAH